MGERKTLICFHDPGGAAPSVGTPATSTRPSAGESTAADVAESGTRRSGSRKKNVKNPASRKNGSADTHPSQAARPAATASAPKMKGKPDGSIRTGERAGRR